MWPFNSEPPECAAPDSEHRSYHEGPLGPDEDLGKWRRKFDPIAHDDVYVYGYVEENPYALCENCGNKVKDSNMFIDKEFQKVRKENIEEADLEQIEVTLDYLKLR